MVLTQHKNTVETVKTVVIAVLVAGVLGFVAGVMYQKHDDAAVSTQAKAISAAVQPSK